MFINNVLKKKFIFSTNQKYGDCYIRDTIPLNFKIYLLIELMFIVCWMLHPQVDFRSKIKDVITYPWFTRPVDINKYNYEFVLGRSLIFRAVFFL